MSENGFITPYGEGIWLDCDRLGFVREVCLSTKKPDQERLEAALAMIGVQLPILLDDQPTP